MVSSCRFETRHEVIFNGFNLYNLFNSSNIKNLIFKYKPQIKFNKLLKKNKVNSNFIKNLIKYFNLSHTSSLYNLYNINNYKFINFSLLIKSLKNYNKFNTYKYLRYIYHNLISKSMIKFFNFKTLKKFNETTMKFNAFKIRRRYNRIFKKIFISYITFFKKVIYKNLTLSSIVKFSNNFFFIESQFFVLGRLLFIKYGKYVRAKLFKRFGLKKNNRLNKILFYIYQLNNIFRNEIYKNINFNFLIDNQFFIHKLKNKINFIYIHIIKLFKLIYFNNFFINFFFNKFSLFKKQNTNKISKKLLIFYNYLVYSKNFSLKNYNFLILTLFLKFSINLKYYFYYIFYKYTYKDQKNFFDLYKYIYKIYNKNNILNLLKIFNLNIFKNFNSLWSYKNLNLNKRVLKQLNYKLFHKFFSLLKFKKYKKQRAFFIKNILKYSKNRYLLKYLKYINYLFYKFNYRHKWKKIRIKQKQQFNIKLTKLHFKNKLLNFDFPGKFFFNKYIFFNKFRTLNPLGSVFNKNKLANLFLLNTEPNGFNVLNLRKKIYYTSCLNN
jgi:hypothetical protein